jgi:serine/threonine protein kinase
MLMDTVETAEEYKKSEVPYTLDERLGEGAFGEVFKAIEDGGEGRTFAIKYIKCTENFDENNDANEDLKNALNEISLLVPLKHMNIVRIIDFGARQFWQMEVEFSLVLEYCSNGQLSDYLGESISKSRKLGWIRSITSAVVYLHDKKITHQDLKPDNVLLAEGDVIKLADFGLARRFGRPVKGTECKHVLPTLYPAIS